MGNIREWCGNAKNAKTTQGLTGSPSRWLRAALRPRSLGSEPKLQALGINQQQSRYLFFLLALFAFLAFRSSGGRAARG